MSKFTENLDKRRSYQVLGPTKAAIHCKDLRYSVAADWSSDDGCIWRVEYAIYDITGVALTPCSNEYGLCWQGRDNLYEENFSRAVPSFTASVKYDGCSDWRFGLEHFCEREELVAFGRVMQLCWDWTVDLCPDWDP